MIRETLWPAQLEVIHYPHPAKLPRNSAPTVLGKTGKGKCNSKPPRCRWESKLRQRNLLSHLGVAPEVGEPLAEPQFRGGRERCAPASVPPTSHMCCRKVLSQLRVAPEVGEHLRQDACSSHLPPKCKGSAWSRCDFLESPPRWESSRSCQRPKFRSRPGGGRASDHAFSKKASS